VNISSNDIVDGSPKLILGLVWSIILHWQVNLAFIMCIFIINNNQYLINITIKYNLKCKYRFINHFYVNY